MVVADIINNPNLETDFEWRISLVNSDYDIIKNYESYREHGSDEIPIDILNKQVCFITIGSCFSEKYNTNLSCLIIEVNI